MFSLAPVRNLPALQLLLPSRKEDTRLREIELTALSGKPDDGGRMTRSRRWADWSMKGLLAAAVSSMVLGVGFHVPWTSLILCSWVARRIAVDRANAAAATRWDAKLANGVRRLAAGGAKLPDDLHRLRALVDRSPVAVEVWRALPPDDTLGMIRLAEQLSAAAAMEPTPTVELGGEASELVSRVADALEATRPAAVAPVLRIL